MRNILNIISGGDTKATDKVLGCSLQVSVAVVNRRKLILGPAEVGVTGDRLCTIKVLESLLGLGLGIRVKAITSEELVRRDTLLRAEFVLGLGKFLL